MQSYRQAKIQADRQTGRQGQPDKKTKTDRWAEGKTGRETDGRTDG